MVDKNYCMSSYMAFRYIERDDMDFYEGMAHKNIIPVPDNEKTVVVVAEDIDMAIRKVFDSIKNQRLGILLSGGMDSAILASYMSGCDAYTFRFLNGEFQKEELARAEYYAKYYGLRLHYVDINWDTVKNNLKPVMEKKNAPVHSIEPQLYQAAIQAKLDNVERLVIGESSDLIFGGMDQLLAKDWTFKEFMDRYLFTRPEAVLKESCDVTYVFERYRMDNSNIDFLKFMDEIFSIESSSSYLNAFAAAEMPYTDPYAKLKMKEPLDLYRVRHGEPKYLVRDLFSLKYPGIKVPDKIPMPRPVDIYFQNWEGPKRPEFRDDIEMKKLSGNQKWQLYCLERFLDIYEPI